MFVCSACMSDADLKRSQLRAAVLDLRERGLSAAARWGAEQLVGLPAPESTDSFSQAVPAASENDVYQLALSLFEAKVITSSVGPRSNLKARDCSKVSTVLCAGIPPDGALSSIRAGQQGRVLAMLCDISGGREAEAVRACIMHALNCSKSMSCMFGVSKRH